MTNTKTHHLRCIRKNRHAAPIDANEFIKRVLQTARRKSKNNLFLTNMFRQFLLAILKFTGDAHEKQKHLPNNEIQIAESAHRLITEDIRKHLSIPEIAVRLEIEWTKLCKVFKQVYGSGIYECLLSERMRVAKEMVTGTEKPFHEIASLVGYKPSSFVYTYTQYHRQTPSTQRALAKLQRVKNVNGMGSIRKLNH